MGLRGLSGAFGVDVSGLPLDTPVSQIVFDRTKGIEGLVTNTLSIRRDGRELTLREAALLQATTWEAPRFVGTAVEVGDQMEDMVDSECCDGFVLSHSPSPLGLARFVDFVVPELQRRGIYRREYSAPTFRGNLMAA
jgi:alkanesulfonate monooxygenase SsuD/methylene tetrahydromethanopterin reductase-like flavin-dependent oxidoreductase (luciferase family)